MRFINGVSTRGIFARFMSNVCNDCGGALIGDGYKTVLHCEEVPEELYSESEPDANPIMCGFNAKSQQKRNTTADHQR